MTTEILYCVRCHRVIPPRAIDEGRYHFVDGQPVCRQCFTRLSRRLRPVSGPQAGSPAQPQPARVDLADLDEPAPAAAAPESGRARRVSSRRMAAAEAHGSSHLIFMGACFVIGLLAGGAAYLAFPTGMQKPAAEPGRARPGSREDGPSQPTEEAEDAQKKGEVAPEGADPGPPAQEPAGKGGGQAGRA